MQKFYSTFEHKTLSFLNKIDKFPKYCTSITSHIVKVYCLEFTKLQKATANNLSSNLLKITSRAISMIIEHTIVDSHIISKAQFKYYKEISADEIFRHIKDTVADSTQLYDDILSFLFCDLVNLLHLKL